MRLDVNKVSGFSPNGAGAKAKMKVLIQVSAKASHQIAHETST
jgi:hypothetical protein